MQTLPATFRHHPVECLLLPRLHEARFDPHHPVPNAGAAPELDERLEDGVGREEDEDAVGDAGDDLDQAGGQFNRL